jgi:hypothetical protein
MQGLPVAPLEKLAMDNGTPASPWMGKQLFLRAV